MTMPSSKQIAACVIVCLAASLFFFAPRLWLMRKNAPGTYQWDRARTYLKQVEDPFRRDVEPAMLWRLLPPLVAKAAGLRGNAALVLPWLGILAATGYVAVLCRRRLDHVRFVYGGTLLFTTSSAVLAPAHWLGLNDAWVWLGLLAVAFGRARWALPIACLFTPWIDERFIIGLPLALVVRALDRGERIGAQRVAPLLWLLPYALVRVVFSADASAAAPIREFLRGHVEQIAIIAPWAPLGWWMAWRAAWLAIGYACWRPQWLLAGTAGATLLISMALAADLSRSAAILAPAMFLGLFDYARRAPDMAPRMALWVGVANLLIPALHVTYTKIDPINVLPIEVMRLFRIPA
jgi:hypothetical protein